MEQILREIQKDGGINMEKQEKEALELTNEILENLWEEFEDILFVEDPDSDDCCFLVLAFDWENDIHNFPAGTSRDEIWHWFDAYHSKGVGWLLNGTM